MRADIACKYVALGTLALLAWSCAASLAFLTITGSLHDPAVSWFDVPSLWWQYLAVAGRDKKETMAVSLSALIAFAPVFIILYRRQQGPKVRPYNPFWGRRAVERGSSDNHGHADWLPIPALRRLFPGPHPDHGGIVVGEAYRVDQDSVAGVDFDPDDRSTWGQGGKAPLLIDPCTKGSTHSLMFAGSGLYKTTSIISTLLTWRGGRVVMDPSCEIGPMVERALRKQGQEVGMLGPETAQQFAPNVLDWIDTADTLAETQVMSVVGWVCGQSRRQRGGDHSQEAQFFASQGRKLVATLLADMLWDDNLPPEDKTLKLLRDGIGRSETAMKALLKAVAANSRSRMARQNASALMDMAADETFSGIHSNANEQTFWLSIEAFADLVSGRSYRCADLTGGDLSVFLQLPLDALESNPEIARVLVGAHMNAMFKADGNYRKRTLFEIDEARFLGDMPILTRVLDAGRKYGITLQAWYQSVGQMLDIWGPNGKRVWYDGVSWRGYAGITDLETAKEVSDLFGTYGVVAYSEGENSGRNTAFNLTGGSRSTGQAQNRHEIKKTLIAPHELIQDARDDEQFIIRRGQPIRCGRAVFFRRPEFVEQVEENRFARVAQTVGA